MTGLTVVDTALFSWFGKLVILLLIQFGGLGIITFMTVFLTNPRGRISFASRKLIGDYTTPEIGSNPRRIVGSVVLFTLVIELAGALALYPVMRGAVVRQAGFHAVFHAVSAFCNAGFSTFRDNLEGFTTSPVVNITIMLLIVLGGIGFVVMEDLRERAIGRRRRLSLHTRLVLALTGLLIVAGTAVYLAFEWSRAYARTRARTEAHGRRVPGRHPPHGGLRHRCPVRAVGALAGVHALPDVRRGIPRLDGRGHQDDHLLHHPRDDPARVRGARGRAAPAPQALPAHP